MLTDKSKAKLQLKLRKLHLQKQIEQVLLDSEQVAFVDDVVNQHFPNSSGNNSRLFDIKQLSQVFSKIDSNDDSWTNTILFLHQ